MKFNINHEIKVKLTDKGRKILENQYKEFIEENPNLKNEFFKTYTSKKEDENGWSIWQMWVLMETFGRYLYNGCDLPFETEIEILDEKYKTEI